MAIPLKRGFYQTDRNVLTNQIFGNKCRIAVWSYVTSQAGYGLGHWRDRQQIIMLKPGDVVCSMRTASRECGMARETFKRCLVELEKKGLLVLKPMATGTLVSLTSKAFNAAFRPPGKIQSHKEIKVIRKSYSNSVDPVSKDATTVRNWVLGAEATQILLQEYAKPMATAIPEEARALLSKLKGVE